MNFYRFSSGRGSYGGDGGPPVKRPRMETDYYSG